MNNFYSATIYKEIVVYRSGGKNRKKRCKTYFKPVSKTFHLIGKASHQRLALEIHGRESF